MRVYDYLESVKEDVEEMLRTEYAVSEYSDREELEEVLNDELFVNDSVTGNASGSYTMNRYKAMECVIDNLEILEEALNEFGVSRGAVGERFLNQDWEYFDVTIRCYMLSTAISEVLDEIYEEEE